jgi:hypothetical protein
MRAVAIVLSGLMMSGAALAADTGTMSKDTTKEKTTIKSEPGQTTVQKESKRSAKGDLNANDPSSPNRATGTERAEQRHEMKEERKTSKSGATRERTTKESTTIEGSGTGGTAGTGMSGGTSGSSSTTTKSTETTKKY